MAFFLYYETKESFVVGMAHRKGSSGFTCWGVEFWLSWDTAFHSEGLKATKL